MWILRVTYDRNPEDGINLNLLDALNKADLLPVRDIIHLTRRFPAVTAETDIYLEYDYIDALDCAGVLRFVKSEPYCFDILIDKQNKLSFKEAHVCKLFFELVSNNFIVVLIEEPSEPVEVDERLQQSHNQSYYSLVMDSSFITNENG